MAHHTITRETMPELAAEDGTPPPEPLPPGYGEILAAIGRQAGEGCAPHPRPQRVRDRIFRVP
ncbi:hypothetical protein [Streptomyces sp. NPDC054961]